MGPQHVERRPLCSLGDQFTADVRCARPSLPRDSSSAAWHKPAEYSPRLTRPASRVAAAAGVVARLLIGPALISIGLGTWEPIPPRGKAHVIPGPLQGRDFWYMAFNKAYIPAFFYHTLRYMWTAEPEYVLWAPHESTALNTVVATALLFLVYDFFYSLFHRALHHRKLCVTLTLTLTLTLAETETASLLRREKERALASPLPGCILRVLASQRTAPPATTTRLLVFS